MAELKVFDQKMYDNIKEDFKRGGKHEKVFKCIMLFWFCVFIVFMIFNFRYNTRPVSYQVCNAYYVDAKDSEYYVNTFYIDVEVEGKVSNADYNEFIVSAVTEYKSQFQDAYIMIVRFFERYRINENTGEPDRRPIKEITYHIYPE